LDPQAPNVMPAAGLDAAIIGTHTIPPNALPLGIVGGVLLVRLTDASGQRILDKPFNWRKDEPRIPPGHYTLEAYFMGCDGNCGNLSDPAPPFCHAEITAAPQSRIEVEVGFTNLSPGTTCKVSSRPDSGG